MQRRPIPVTRLRRGRPIRLLVAMSTALALVALTSAAADANRTAPLKLKLPAERTSPTGNFFTLKAYIAPTASKHVAEFDMKVCTSAHTPSYTAIEPSFFTLSLAQGGIVMESVSAAKQPAMVMKPLKPLQCTEGWLGFNVPKGKTVSALVYEYNGKISWKVG